LPRALASRGVGDGAKGRLIREGDRGGKPDAAALLD